MDVKQALPEVSSLVGEITLRTIDAVYPLYYPPGAVEFFKRLHSGENIRKDVEHGWVYLLFAEGKAVGTITIRENHILRLFVLWEFQHRGFGKYLLDFAENMIAKDYREIIIDASFPAKHIYLKRGYVEREYHALRTERGDYLCYDVMVKQL